MIQIMAPSASCSVWPKEYAQAILSRCCEYGVMCAQIFALETSLVVANISWIMLTAIYRMIWAQGWSLRLGPN